MEKPMVLIVDDVPHNIQIVGNLLGPEYEVFFALSGPEALKIAAQQPLTLVLMDVMMPGMSGLEAARELAKIPGHQDTPVIFLTALTEKDQVLAGFEAGGVDYITKPFHKNELLARVRTHVALKTAREELHKARVARDRFFAILAHDLKNPFQALLGLLGTVLEDWDSLDPREVRSIVEGVHDSSKKAYDLLLNLLEWGRTQTGGLRLRPASLRAGDLFASLKKTLEASLGIKNITLDIQDTRETFWADRDTVEIILRNLLTNAIKFSPPGSRIGLTAARDGEAALIQVKDQGVGMEELQQKSLFDLSVRNSTKGTAGETGTGLGLVLCRSFALANGGDLTFTSAPGQGTEFVLKLPLNPPGSVS